MLELQDVYENGSVELRVYDLDGTKKYWIRVGAALLELDEESLLQLFELLYSYTEEN